MSLFIIISLVGALVALIALTSFLSCKCPHCGRFGLRPKSSKIVENKPIIISKNDTGAITLRGHKIVRHTTMHCKDCDRDVVYVEEKIN